ncbi:MAG TPA: STAS domain-containing protein [Cyclobacteriaceae bacterium]
MEFNHKIEGNTLILTMHGDLIGENSGPEIIEIVNNALSDKMINCIIDIENIRYINSSGIGVLITILTKFRNQGGETVLLKPSEQVKRLLIITKLNSIFTIVQTKEEAKSNFQA